MAAKTSTGAAIISGATSAAGSTYASPSAGCQSASQDQTTFLGAVWTGRITNGATGPTVACTWQVDISHDGTTWRNFASGQGAIANNLIADLIVELPLPIMYTRITFFGNTVQPVTVSAELERVTGIT